MMLREDLVAIAAEQPYPLLFATVSGAHLYGFASTDSDIDLRGVHILPVREVVGLDVGPQTIEAAGPRGGQEINLISLNQEFRLPQLEALIHKIF